jgi:hypothetical protein
MSTVSKLWALITDGDRAAWNQYAIDHPVPDWTGSPKRLTGMNWFMKCLILLRRVGGADIDIPPAVAAPNSITGLVLSKVGTDLSVAWTAPTGAGLWNDVWVAGPLSTGRAAKLPQAKPTQLLDATAGTVVDLIPAATAGRYTAFARIIDEDTGLASTWVSAYFDMT